MQRSIDYFNNNLKYRDFNILKDFKSIFKEVTNIDITDLSKNELEPLVSNLENIIRDPRFSKVDRTEEQEKLKTSILTIITEFSESLS